MLSVPLNEEALIHIPIFWKATKRCYGDRLHFDAGIVSLLIWQHPNLKLVDQQLLIDILNVLIVMELLHLMLLEV